MGLTVELPYLRRAASGRWEYRRRVPDALKAFAGKGTWKRVLKAEDGRALLLEHARVDAEYERDMKAAEAQRRRAALASSGSASPRELWAEAQRWAAEMLPGVHGPDEDGARDVLADSIAARYPEDPDDGNPVGLTPLDTMKVVALLNPDAEPPAPTLKDARDVYVRLKLRGGTPQEDGKSVERVDRMMREVEAALGKVPVLAEMTREDARKVLAHMEGLMKRGGGKLAPESVRRNLNTLRALVTFGAVELGLPATFRNHFNKLNPAGLEDGPTEGEKRDPLPIEVLGSVRERIMSGAGAELALIWRILQGTGCRLAEVTGLRVQDVSVGGESPNAKVTWHEGRRVKTKSSRRHVPLVGDALGAAKEALALPREGTMLFPSYGDGERGAGAASAALMRHVRKVSLDRRHVVYSLRHNMADWLREAPMRERNIIMGHALGGVGERVYGGKPAELRATTKALRAALAEAAAQGFPGAELTPADTPPPAP